MDGEVVEGLGRVQRLGKGWLSVDFSISTV